MRQSKNNILEVIMKRSLWHMSLLATLLGLTSNISHAKVNYDLKNTQQAATIAKYNISNTLLDIMHKVSIAKKAELTRGDVLTALIENQLLGQYALKRFGESQLVENNKVSFLPSVVAEQEFRAVIQVAFDKELAEARKKLGGNLDKKISQEQTIKANEWDSFLPSKKVLQLNIQLDDTGQKAAQKRVLLQYQFDDKHKGTVTLWDVYQRQNVQGRNEINSRNSDFTQSQAREIVVHRFIDYWVETQSNLSKQDIADIQQAILNKSYHDGFVSMIGIAADIHDDVQYLKDLAKKVTPAEVKAYYQKHKDEFKRIVRVKAQHIALADEKTANMVAEQLKKGGNFGQLAKQYSTAMDKTTGGDLGWVVHEPKNPTWLNSLAFIQPINTPSRPIRTPTGQWEILLVTQKEEGYQPVDGESVRYLASQVIARQKMVKEYQTIRKTLIKQTDIHISPILKPQMLSLENDVIIVKPSEADHHH